MYKQYKIFLLNEEKEKMDLSRNKFFWYFVLIVSTIVIVGMGVLFTTSQKNLNKKVIQKKEFVKSIYSKEPTKYKTTIRVCQSETPPLNLDPISLSSKQEEITFHIFDRLVRWNEKGDLQLSLAESIKINNDTSYLIKLRKGIKFHNGEDFDSESVKFTFDRLMNPNTKSPIPALLRHIKQVRVIDKYNLELTTYKPYYLMYALLSYIQIIPKKYFLTVGEKDFGRRPIGTSSFVFIKWTSDGTIILDRNENYWGTPPPKLKRIIFKFIPKESISAENQVDALLNGEIDVLTDVTGIHSIKIQKNPNTKLIKILDAPIVNRMLFNSIKGPFKDVRLRKAANIGINRELYIKVLAKGNGKNIATNTVSSELCYDPTLKPYVYDVNEAKKLVLQTGLKKINIKIAAIEGTELLAKAIIKDLQNINIYSKLEVLSKEEMGYKISQAQKSKSKTWEYDLAIYSTIDPLMHGGINYEGALYSKGPWTTTNNKEVDLLIEQMKVTISKPKQKLLCNKIEQLAYNNYWYTPVYQVITLYGASKDLVLKPYVSTYLDLNEAYFK